MKPIHHLLFLVIAGNFTLLAARPALADNDEKALDNVVTTATLSARSSADVPAFTTVVTADDIAKTSVNSLPDLLRSLRVAGILYDDSLPCDRTRSLTCRLS